MTSLRALCTSDPEIFSHALSRSVLHREDATRAAIRITEKIYKRDGLVNPSFLAVEAKDPPILKIDVKYLVEVYY